MQLLNKTTHKMNQLKITSPDGRVSFAPTGNLDFFEVYNSRVKDADKFSVEEVDASGNVIATHFMSAKVSQLDVIKNQADKIKELEMKLKQSKTKVEPLTAAK